MLKRDELSNPNSCLRKALSRERLFVLLTRDETAPDVVMYWVRERLRRGLNRPDDEQIREAVECSGLMESERAGIRQTLREMREARDAVIKDLQAKPNQ